MPRQFYDAQAATHVPADLRELAADIAWRQIVGTRNRVAHGYLGLEPETLWLVISDSVPRPLAQLRSLLDRLPPPG